MNRQAAGARLLLVIAIATATAGALAPAAARGATPVAVTVQELIRMDHRLTVPAGTEVLWNDPHFERVWFPANAQAPRVVRMGGGFRAVFDKPGTYRGRFTIIGGHRSNDVYPLVVEVTGP